MNLLKNRKILKGLLKQVNAVNTINGGIAPVSAEILTGDKNIIIKLKEATVGPEGYSLWMEQNTLLIYSVVGNDEEMLEQGPIPSFIYSVYLPLTVQTDEIQAVFEDNELRIIIPVTDMDSAKRDINIRRL